MWNSSVFLSPSLFWRACDFHHNSYVHRGGESFLFSLSHLVVHASWDKRYEWSKVVSLGHPWKPVVLTTVYRPQTTLWCSQRGSFLFYLKFPSRYKPSVHFAHSPVHPRLIEFFDFFPILSSRALWREDSCSWPEVHIPLPHCLLRESDRHFPGRPGWGNRKRVLENTVLDCAFFEAAEASPNKATTELWQRYRNKLKAFLAVAGVTKLDANGWLTLGLPWGLCLRKMDDM